MDIQTTKIELIKEILDIDNQDLLKSIFDFIETENLNFKGNNLINENLINYNNKLSSEVERKLTFIKDFLSLNDESTLIKLENLLLDKKDFWDELSQNQKDEINLGIEQLNKGKRFSYESVLKELT